MEFDPKRFERLRDPAIRRQMAEKMTGLGITPEMLQQGLQAGTGQPQQPSAFDFSQPTLPAGMGRPDVPIGQHGLPAPPITNPINPAQPSGAPAIPAGMQGEPVSLQNAVARQQAAGVGNYPIQQQQQQQQPQQPAYNFSGLWNFGG